MINRQWLDDKMKRNNGKNYFIGYFLKFIKTKDMHIFTIPVSAWNRIVSLTSRHTINWSVSKVPSWHTFVAPIWPVNKIELCRRIRKQNATRIVLSIFFLNPISSFSLLLWLYSLCCLCPGRKPKLFVFSPEGSNFYCMAILTIKIAILTAWFCCNMLNKI